MKNAISIFSLLLLTACQTTGGKFPPSHTASPESYTVSRHSEILIVYIAAENCPPCWKFKDEHLPLWLKSKEYSHVQYRELNFPFFEITGADKYWPSELRWIRDKTNASSGAPRWIVVVDGRIVSNEKSWSRRAYPFIQRLVDRKLAA